MKPLLPVLLAAAAAVAGTAWWMRSSSVPPAGAISGNRPKGQTVVPPKSIRPPASAELPKSGAVLEPLTQDAAGPAPTISSSIPPVRGGDLTPSTGAPLAQAPGSADRRSVYSKFRRAPRPGTVPPESTPPSSTGDDSEAGAPEPPELTVPFSLTHPGQPAAIPAALALKQGGQGLTEVERAGIDQVAADFLAQIPGGSQDPQDPDYQKLWAEAAAQSDAQLRSRFGGETWLRQHAEAYRQALGNTPPDPGP